MTARVLREAEAKCAAEATELAKRSAPDLTVEYPDLAAAADHLAAMREMRIRYAMAEVFGQWARMAELDPDLLNRVGGRQTVNLARVVLGASRDSRSDQNGPETALYGVSDGLAALQGTPGRSAPGTATGRTTPGQTDPAANHHGGTQ